MIGSGIQSRVASNPFITAMSMGARNPTAAGAAPMVGTPKPAALPDQAQPAKPVAADKPPPTPVLPPNFMANPQAMRRSIQDIESGGNYQAIGPVTKGDRPYGAYQVMGRNIPSWTQKYLGKAMSPEEFLANPAAQDAVFDGEFGGYVKKFGLEGAAQAWIGGPGSVGKVGRKDVLGTSVGTYGQRFVQGLQKYGGQNVALMAASTTENPAERYHSRMFGSVRADPTTDAPMEPGSGEQRQKSLLQQALSGSGGGGGGGGGVQTQQAEASEAPPVQDEADAYLEPVVEQLAQRRAQPKQQRRGAPQVRRV